MTRAVIFSPEAQDDLRQVSLYIAGQSGPARAIAYLDRIETNCTQLQDFPERGTRRDDLWPGLRTIGFERRVTIAFTVAPDAVTILRILYGGRDLAAAFDAETTGQAELQQSITDGLESGISNRSMAQVLDAAQTHAATAPST